MKTYLSLTMALALAACAAKPDAESAADSQAKTDQAVAAVSTEAASKDLAETMNAGFEAKINTVLAGDHRTQANRDRDQYRHPKETLEFFGLKDSMTVIEISPGAGWFSEILAPMVSDYGQFYVAVNDPTKVSNERARDYYAKANADLEAKFKARPDLYGKAELVLMDATAPNLGKPASADMVLTFRNAHNWMGQGVAPQMFKAFFDVLKPGGVLGLKDHRAAPGSDPKATADSGYVSEESVIELAKAAGFVLEEKSEINANPRDTKDHEGGVWTLPPTLGMGDKDREKYLAIGESDRMTLRFRKPL